MIFSVFLFPACQVRDDLQPQIQEDKTRNMFKKLSKKVKFQEREQ